MVACLTSEAVSEALRAAAAAAAQANSNHVVCLADALRLEELNQPNFHATQLAVLISARLEEAVGAEIDAAVRFEF